MSEMLNLFRLLYWRARLWFAGMPAISGAADDEDDDGKDDDDEVDEDELDPKVKAVLKKERRARRDAEKATREAQREATKERASLQAQISELEAKVESAADDGNGEETEALQKKVTELETQLGEATKAAETAATDVKRARLQAELLKPEYAVAADAVDLVVERLDVEYDKDGMPTGVKDAVEDLLEKRPSLKRQEEAQGPGVSAGNTDAQRSRGAQMTAEDAKKLARDNPDEFNKKFEAGEIPAGALGG